MVDIDKTLTTGEFSEMTGFTVSAIAKMLRQGKIRGEKRGGKWAIYESELQNNAVITKNERGNSSANLGPIFDTPPAAGKAYDVEAFVKMTYLTEKGVRQWLKIGRLSGSTDTGGKVLVNATNLDRPELRHLIRK